MQCTSYYRDPYEDVAWRLYLRECALRAAREEVAFLEATGGATVEDMQRIRDRVLQSEDKVELVTHSGPAIKQENERVDTTISLKSVLLAEADHHDAINRLCRRVKPLLDESGIVTFKKHNALHVLKTDADRVRRVAANIMSDGLM